MHTCKVNTTKRFSINQNTYNQIYDDLKKHGFLDVQKESDALFHLKREKYITINEFELPLKKTISQLYTIPIVIEQKQYQFLLDTGAQISAIRKPLLNKIKVIKANQAIDIGSIGGSKTSLETYFIPQMQLGGISFINSPVVLLDEEKFALKLGMIDFMNFDGIIGWDILSQLDFEIDDIEHKFIVLNNHYRFKEKNMILGGFPLFLCKDKSGKILKMGFDSGAQVSWLGIHYMNTYPKKQIRKANALGFGVNGKESIAISLLDHLELTLDKANIQIDECMSGIVDFFQGFQLDGVLGNEIFKKRRIRILNSVERVIFL